MKSTMVDKGIIQKVGNNKNMILQEDCMPQALFCRGGKFHAIQT